jgi:hypothetical protein
MQRGLASSWKGVVLAAAKDAKVPAWKLQRPERLG